MPGTDPAAACELVKRYLRDLPAWPQLPERSFRENMYAQYSEGFPGAVIEDDRIYVDRSKDLNGPLEKLYSAYLDNDPSGFGISADYAAGLHRFLRMTDLNPLAIKGHVTGPVSWGLAVTDQDRKPILYDETLADAAARLLRLKAMWLEAELQMLSRNTIIFVDEPYMSSFGSAFVAISKEKVHTLIGEVFGGITGLKGVHCCGNTDWSVLLGTGLDILSFDAYNYAASLALYPKEVKRFLDGPRAIAWGIVPNNPENLAKESVSSLKDRLEEAMAPFTRNGVRFRDLVAQSLVTPSCTLMPLKTTEAVVQAFELLNGLSQAMRSRYL
jgi:hypothetical protein